MKRIARTTFGLVLASAGIAASDEGGISSPTPNPARRLKAAYSLLSQTPGDRDILQAYLEVFPADALSFSALFSPENPGQIPEARGYIAALQEVGRLYPVETFEKLLHLQSMVRWEAGSLDELQRVTLRLALANPKAFAAALTAQKPRERAAVAAFLADGPEGPPEETLGLAAKLEVAGFGSLAATLRNEANLSEAHQERS